MEIDTIIAAIVAGFVAASKETAAQAVKDGYKALKDFVTSRIAGANFTAIEEAPESPDRQKVLAAELGEGRFNDLRFIHNEAKKLLDLVAQHDRAARSSVTHLLEET